MILGRYTPTIDSIALLVDTKKYKFKELERDIFGTNNPLERVTLLHEFMGHVRLTRSSSYWSTLFLANLKALSHFRLMFRDIDTNLTKTRLDRIKENCTSLVTYEKINDIYHYHWEPLQEAIANVYLISLKRRAIDEELKNKINPLIKKRKSDSEISRIINEFTKQSVFILDHLGVDTGWTLLAYMAAVASSPNHTHGTWEKEPKDFDDIIRMDLNRFERGFKIGLEDPSQNSPNDRFVEMLVVAKKCIDEIKRSIKRGVHLFVISMRIAYMCGLELEPVKIRFSKMMDQEKTQVRLAPNNLKKDAIVTKNMLKALQKIVEEDFPTFWFLNDINSGKIFFQKSKITKAYSNLNVLLQDHILKYQFMKSMKERRDLIECFENKLHFCKSNCKDCVTYSIVKKVKKLYKISSEFEYSDLLRKGFDKDRFKEALYNF